MDNGEIQYVQVTLQGVKMGAELSEKAIIALKNLVVLLYNKGVDKNLQNAKGHVSKKKLNRITKDQSCVQIADKDLEKFNKIMKDLGIPYTPLRKFKSQIHSDRTFVLYASSDSKLMAEALSILEKENIDKEVTRPISLEELVKEVGADMDTFITDSYLEAYPEDAEWINGILNNVFNEKKNDVTEIATEIADGIKENEFKVKAANTKDYDFMTIPKENFIKSEDEEHYRVCLNDTKIYVDIPKNQARFTEDGECHIVIKKDQELKFTHPKTNEQQFMTLKRLRDELNKRDDLRKKKTTAKATDVSRDSKSTFKTK